MSTPKYKQTSGLRNCELGCVQFHLESTSQENVSDGPLPESIAPVSPKPSLYI